MAIRRQTNIGLRDRSAFIVRVYGHLFAAITAVVLLEVILFRSGIADIIGRRMLSVPWILVLGAFVLLGWLARKMAFRERGLAAQYAGLILYIIGKSIILIPLLYLADRYAPGAIQQAAWLTIIGFVGLTSIVMYSKKDFTFLRSLLRWAGFMAFILIIAALVFHIRLGTWFDLGMITLAGASILYDTSKIMRRYSDDRYVAAALDLFASIALMFWYSLRLFRRFGGRAET